VKAVICPVCIGEGKVCIDLDDNLDPITKECHGCGGLGWVEVGEDCPPVCPSPLIFPYPDTVTINPSPPSPWPYVTWC